MPFDWNDLFKYDTTFNPQYEQQQRTEPLNNIGGNRLAQLAMPEYDTSAMRRYSEYLGSEPTRDQYKPNRWQNLLYGLTGGLEAMSSGNIARGLQLTDALRDRPFEEAYRSWNQRGNKVKADVELANVDYKNRSAAYNNAQQRSLEERRVANTERQTDLDILKYNNDGYKMELGPRGTLMATRVRNGQVETIDTQLPNNKLTAEQEQKQTEFLEEGRNSRAQLASDTSTANNRRSVGASIYNTDMTRQTSLDRLAQDSYEGRKTRESHERIAQMPARSRPKDVTPPTPTDMRNRIGILEKGYPEFNTEGLVRIDPASGQPQYSTDVNTIRKKLQELSGGDPNKYNMLQRRWIEFNERMDQFPITVRR